MEVNKNNPVISVIILTHNQENTISLAIESVLNQKCCFPFEIIIGEDCSTDSTLKVCKEYAKKFPNKIRLIETKINKGLIDNYYDCILEAKGKYIADCAGDDYWTDEYKLEKQGFLLEKHPEVSLVHSAWNYLNNETLEVYEPTPPIGGFKFRQPFINGSDLIVPYLSGEESPTPIVHLSTSLYRKDLFLKSYENDIELYRNKDFKCEDVPVITTMMASGYIAFIQDNVLNYRVGHSSVSSDEDYSKTFDFYFGVLRLKLRLIEKYGMYEVLDKKSFQKNVHYILSLAFNSLSSNNMKSIYFLVKESKLKTSMKGKMYFLFSKNKYIWKLAKQILKR